MEVKIDPFIHDMNKLRQNISPSGNSFVDVPPARENNSHKMLIIFYRTASNGVDQPQAIVAQFSNHLRKDGAS